MDSWKTAGAKGLIKLFFMLSLSLDIVLCMDPSDVKLIVSSWISAELSLVSSPQ